MIPASMVGGGHTERRASGNDTGTTGEDTSSRQLFNPTIQNSRVEYAIITDSQFVDELTPLAEWKTRKGVAAKIFKTSDIYSTPQYAGVDKAEQIHKFLRDLKSQSPYLQWVLLAGDADAGTNANDAGSPYVPSRYLYTGGTANGVNDYYWSDAYFGGLSGDWDNDGDGRYGEIDEDFWYPGGTGTNGDESPKIFDAYVGRLPADTDSEMQTIVNKILTYERDPANGDWFKTAVLWGGLMDAPNDGTYLNDSENAYEIKHDRVKPLLPSHMTINEYYDMAHKDPPYDPDDDNLNRNNAINSVNSGASFINFAGQAYYDGWALLEYSDPAGIGTISGIPYFGFDELYWYTDGASATNGGMLPLMYLSGCDAAVFNFTGSATDRSQERMLTNPNGGAIGVISSTAHTFRGEENENSYGNWWLDENFVKLMFQDGYYQPGKALYKLKEKTFEDIEGGEGGNAVRAVRSNTYGYILLGDPELNIWTNIPRSLAVTVEDLYIEAGAAHITVKDSFNNQPVEGALVNIQNIELYLQGYTNATGVATIPMNPLATGAVEVIVTAHNYYPRELELAVTQKPVDLAVDADNIWLEITEPMDGDDVQVFARVFNRGGTDLGQQVNVRFYQDDPISANQIGSDRQVVSINAGDSDTVTTTWTAKYKPVPYRIYVSVDPDNNLPNEYTKDNNLAYITVSVKGTDLTISDSDVIISPDLLVGENQEINVNVTVHNNGFVHATDVKIGLYDGEPKPGGENEIATTAGPAMNIPIIYRNSSSSIGASFKLSGGKHDVNIFADAGNGTYEISEDNNIVIRTIRVNYAPEFGGLADIIIDEDHAKEKVFDLRDQKYIYDRDNLTSEMRFSVLSIEPSGNLSVAISSNRYVDLYPAENWTTPTSVLVTLQATDGLSMDTATFNVSVRADDDPPAIDPLGTVTGKAGEPVSFTVTAYDADGDALFFSDDSDIFDIDPYSGVVNFTANDTHVATKDITIKVSDGSHEVSMTFSLEIRPRDNLPPVLEHIEDVEATVGKPFKLILRATDPDGDRLVFSMDQPLFSITRVSDTTAQLAFTANAEDVMKKEVFIIVSDGVETDAQKVMITIKEKKDSGSTSIFDKVPIMALVLIIAVMIMIIVVLFFLIKRRKSADRDMQIWESMDSEREKRPDDSSEDLGPLDRDDLKRERSTIEQELLDPSMSARDKPEIQDAEYTDIPDDLPPIIEEEAVPELPKAPMTVPKKKKMKLKKKD